MLVVDQMNSEVICQRVETGESVIGVVTSSRLGVRIFLYVIVKNNASLHFQQALDALIQEAVEPEHIDLAYDIGTKWVWRVVTRKGTNLMNTGFKGA